MSKERLEEIKQRKSYLLDLQENGDITWLIEQAERVQELESDYEHLESIIDRVYFDRAREISRANELDRQNNRYREALELLNKVSASDMKDEQLTSSHFVLDITGDALEQSE